MKAIKDLGLHDYIRVGNKEEARLIFSRLNELGKTWKTGTPYLVEDFLDYNSPIFIRPSWGTFTIEDLEGDSVYWFKDLADFWHEEVPPNPQEIGFKESEGKLPWEVDFYFLEEIAKRMEAESKYPPYNWHKKLPVKKLFTAGWRHYIELMKGNYEDNGQKYGHIFGVVTNLMMAYYQLEHYDSNTNELRDV